MAAYLKDVENNTRDMTADRIIEEKRNRIEMKDVRIHAREYRRGRKLFLTVFNKVVHSYLKFVFQAIVLTKTYC